MESYGFHSLEEEQWAKLGGRAVPVVARRQPRRRRQPRSRRLYYSESTATSRTSSTTSASSSTSLGFVLSLAWKPSLLDPCFLISLPACLFEGERAAGAELPGSIPDGDAGGTDGNLWVLFGKFGFFLGCRSGVCDNACLIRCRRRTRYWSWCLSWSRRQSSLVSLRSMSMLIGGSWSLSNRLRRRTECLRELGSRRLPVSRSLRLITTPLSFGLAILKNPEVRTPNLHL